MREVRRYIVYLSGTQELADKHVASIATALEQAGIERAVNKYGSSKGWRRERLRLENGVTIDSLGLDTAARGIKVEQQRPDLIILDDIDDRHDAPKTVKKKVETITQTVLPAGSNDCAVLAVQNIVHANSIFARLTASRTSPLYADFLSDRIVSGPFPAIEGLKYEWREGLVYILEGIATWVGQSLDVCQQQMRTWGLRAFLRESQHEVKDAEGALWKTETLEANRVSDYPTLVRIGVAVDPSGSKDGSGNECGIIIGGIGWCNCKNKEKPELHGFLLQDASLASDPNSWAHATIKGFDRHKADIVIAEGNYGGEMVRTTLQGVRKNINVNIVFASRGKQARAEPISSLYSEGKIHHVGYFQDLEAELTQWEPDTGAPSPNRLDANVWLWTKLMNIGPGVGDTDSAGSRQENKWTAVDRKAERRNDDDDDDNEKSRWKVGS